MSRLLLVFVSAAIAQVTFHGRFWSTLYGKDVLSTKAMHTLDPPMNNQLLMLASFREEEDPGPPKFAEAIEFPVDSKNNGEWLQRDGLWIWRAQVTSPGALSLSLLFDHFELAEGSEFYIKTDTKLVGAFTPERNNKDDKKFSVAPIEGDELFLQYIEPRNSHNQDVPSGRIKLHKIVHGFRKSGFEGTGAGASGKCNIDVACPEDQIDSVGMMLTDSNQRYCSGVLVNNARRDGTQFFLTAKHCVRDDVSYYIAGFNYEKQQCESGAALEKSTFRNSSVISLAPQAMLQPQTVQGFELLAEWDKTDFALLRIKERIPDHYNAYLAGFDASEFQDRGFTGIHHPMGDFKKISTYAGQITKAAWIDEPAFLVHWQVQAWNRGTTERGSSGSPLFNKRGLVIGHLRGGFSSCDAPLGSDYYGGLAWDWDGDMSGVHSLSRFLDPDQKNVKSLAGMRLNAARFRSNRIKAKNNHPGSDNVEEDDDMN